MLGSDYMRPPAPTAETWIETGDPAVEREAQVIDAWWTVFNDPVLNRFVETADRQNPSLRAAGVRVLEAQARRGIAIGQLFPQQQEAFGDATISWGGLLATEGQAQDLNAAAGTESDRSWWCWWWPKW
jgi:outer membrane protein TolC